MFLKWSDDLVTGLGSKVSDELVASMTGAFAAYSEFTRDIIEPRRTQPTDDLTTVLVHAEVDGQRLSDDEIVMETLLILIGGDEITRHTLSGGTEQLLRHRRCRCAGEPNAPQRETKQPRHGRQAIA